MVHRRDSGLGLRQVDLEPEQPPDGGVRAWLQVLGSFIIFCSTWGLVLSFGAFQPHYQLTMLTTHSASTLSWIGSIQSFLLMSTGIFTGPLFDRGYHRLLLYTGGFLSVFGMMMLSLATELYQVILAQSLVVGLGCGVAYVPSLALTAASFTTKRQAAVTIVTSGTSIGGIIYPLLFQHLILRIGFAWTTRTMGFVAFAGYAIAIPLVLNRGFQIKGNRRALFDTSIRKDPLFLTLCLGGFFRFLGYLGPIFFIPVFAQTALHQSQGTALTLLVVFNAASFIGKLSGPLVATRTKVMIPWFVCSIAAGIVCFAWLAVASIGSFVAFIILFGLVSGPLTTFPPAVVPIFCSTPKIIGTRMGTLWGCAALAFLLGTPIATALSDTSKGHFVGFQVFSGVVLLVGAVLLLPLWSKVNKGTAS